MRATERIPIKSRLNLHRLRLWSRRLLLPKLLASSPLKLPPPPNQPATPPPTKTLDAAFHAFHALDIESSHDVEVESHGEVESDWEDLDDEIGHPYTSRVLPCEASYDKLYFFTVLTDILGLMHEEIVSFKIVPFI